jgi:hypothetical protein
MINRGITFWAALMAILLSPAVAFANMGTPLMLATSFHLVFGNTLIGIGEGALLAFIFRKNVLLCVPVMIVANYFSAWVGVEILDRVNRINMSGALDVDLYNFWRWLWTLVAATYVLTLLLEWPFVALCFRKTDGWFRKSVRGALIVQTVSYVVIFGWYWAASDKSLYADLTVVQPSAISLPEKTIVYYIAASDGDAYAIDLHQGTTRKVRELKSIGNAERLFAKESKKTPGHWNLVASNEIDERSEGITKTVVTDFSREVARPQKSEGDDKTKSLFGQPVATPPQPDCDEDVLQFAGASNTDWELQLDSWSGWYGKNSKDGRKVRVFLETPFVAWYSRSATRLPSGQVVLQLGRDQICVLDSDGRKIALIAKGRCPVVGIENNPAQ